jgi:hypothetical protein
VVIIGIIWYYNTVELRKERYEMEMAKKEDEKEGEVK